MHKIITGDKALFLELNTLGNQTFDQFWLMISDKRIWIPLYIIFLYLFLKNFKWKSVIYILIFITLGVAISDQLSGIFKYGIARLRPCHDPELQNVMRVVKCGSAYGFYSAHASNTFFIASFMSLMLKGRIKYLPYILFVWAGVVSYSRIYLGVHFPMDVLFGALVGFLLGGFFSTLAKQVILKQQEKKSFK